MYAKKYQPQTINIEPYLPLVQKVVYQLNFNETSVMDKDDLISIGVLGLMDAAKKYNPLKNASFETYARLRIKGAILDELRRTGTLSRDKISQVKQFYQQRESIRQQLLAEPTDSQLCEYMNITLEELGAIYLSIHHLAVTSLDELAFNQSEQGTTLLDLIPSEQSSVIMLLERHDQVDELTKAIEQLDQREQYILNFYYVEELSLAQISDILDISVSRVSQLHGKAISKLKKILK